MSPRGRQAVRTPEEFGRVAVLLGGDSAERAVSLSSGRAVLAALRARGIDAHPVDPRDDGLAVLRQGGFARAWNALHGRGGEDGTIQGWLAAEGVACTGSDVLGSAIAMDKLRSKQLLAGAGLPTAPFLVVDAGTRADTVVETLGLPLFVKPAREGSSVGMSRVDRAEDLPGAIAAALRYDDSVLAEIFLSGGEYTVALLQGEALPVIRIETPRAFYDYEAKYHADSTRYHCPCGLEAAAERDLAALALAAFETVGACGWGRVDLMLDAAGRAQVLEVNTVPGMTDHSLVPMAAAAAGIDFDELAWRVLETSFKGAAGYRGGADAQED
ncbi:MAG: D-alanine--D-alanine ligase [Gammaproteobacteria bacterium]|nr:D-alanine--D-alanine ligase [Gammaproteobacteria bacterium]TVQ47071.1 MAG: D-alanine--D-alanine ligase [Gammaproteobacteria bacterium]